MLGADAFDAAIINFAREQPQRETDDAGGMREHPLDGEVGLAGVGGPENCNDTASTLRGWNGPEWRGHRLLAGLAEGFLYHNATVSAHFAGLGNEVEHVPNESSPNC